MEAASIKRKAYITLKNILASFGIEAHFAHKSNEFDRVLFDKNMLSYFYDKNNRRIKLYYEGLKRADVEESDNFAKQCKFYSLQQMVEFILKKGLAGDFAECGCWRGHSTYIISKILSENNFKGLFHIFDSFDGLPEKKTEDNNERFELSNAQIENEGKIFVSSEEEVRHTLSEFNFIKLYKGWLPNRFDEIDDRKFSFVHIDVDLYQPTIDGLDFFYPRLLTGGCIVIDDYGLTQFPGCKKAVDLFLSRNKYEMFYEVPISGCFIIK